MYPEDEQNHKAVKIVKRLFFSVVILTVISILSISTSIWFYIKVQNLENPAGSNQAAESSAVIKAVGKLMVLPTDETPTIATVSDLSKLKDQVFFAKAKVGDKVLIYTIARKAVLWRPSTNQLIEVSALNSTDASSKDSVIIKN